MTVSTMMLVEDSGILVSDIQQTLSDESIEISPVVSSGEEALEAVRDDPPDLILMDIKLNGDMDGVEATIRIHEETNIPVIYLTAYSNEKYIDRVRESSALAFLVKPLQKADLIQIINWLEQGKPTPPPELDRGEFL